jgi:hemerythrin-like domain-containing protein
MRDESKQRSGSGGPLRQIAQCHEKIAGHLARLDTIAALDHEAGDETRGALESIVRWFETNGLRHRLDEDESVFPRLAPAAAGRPALADALRDLVAEHAREDALVGRLALAARALAEDPVRGTAMARAAAREVVTHFRRHIDIEDRLVLPAAADALDADALVAVSDEMERRRTEGSCS